MRARLLSIVALLAGCDDGNAARPRGQSICAGAKCDDQTQDADDGRGDEDKDAVTFALAHGRLRECLELTDGLIHTDRLDPDRYADAAGIWTALGRQATCLNGVLDEEEEFALAELDWDYWKWVDEPTLFEERVCRLAQASYSDAIADTVREECLNLAHAMRLNLMLTMLDLEVDRADRFGQWHHYDCFTTAGYADPEAALTCIQRESAQMLAHTREVMHSTGLSHAEIDGCLDLETARHWLKVGCEWMLEADGAQESDAANAIICQAEMYSLFGAVFSSGTALESPPELNRGCEE